MVYSDKIQCFDALNGGERFREGKFARFRSDREVALFALGRKNVSFPIEEEFKSIGEELRKDKGFVVEAMSVCGMALAVVNDWFIGDRDVAMAAVKQNGAAWHYLTRSMKEDREIAVLAAMTYDLLWTSFPPSLRSDKIFISELLSVGKFGLVSAKLLSKALRDDVDIMTLLVKEDGSELRHASERLKDDKRLVLEAVNNDPFAVIYIGNEIKKIVGVERNPKLVAELIRAEIFREKSTDMKLIVEGIVEARRKGGKKSNVVGLKI